MRTGVVGGIADSQTLWGKGRRGYREILTLPTRASVYCQRIAHEMSTCGRRRRLLQFVRRGHHGQGSQPVLRWPPQKVPPAGGPATKRLHSTAPRLTTHAYNCALTASRLSGRKMPGKTRTLVDTPTPRFPEKVPREAGDQRQ